eukprot:scaffold3773_cov94-Isochrysis_galbana.AAC.1
MHHTRFALHVAPPCAVGAFRALPPPGLKPAAFGLLAADPGRTMASRPAVAVRGADAALADADRGAMLVADALAVAAPVAPQELFVASGLAPAACAPPSMLPLVAAAGLVLRKAPDPGCEGAKAGAPATGARDLAGGTANAGLGAAAPGSIPVGRAPVPAAIPGGTPAPDPGRGPSPMTQTAMVRGTIVT